MEVTAINEAKAKSGDTVVIAFETGSLLKLSFFLYIFPILCLLAGALLGQHMAPSFPYDPSFISIFMGFLFFFIAFGLIKMSEKRLSGKKQYQPKIIRIVPAKMISGT